ncbi:MAG: hypothetical protein C1O27_002535 [Chloroflexi bacterium]|jgi:hypothetical protein|nr:MAG: hypothetical protein C1O27_002535 [Chloroflexota bacterium]
MEPQTTKLNITSEVMARMRHALIYKLAVSQNTSHRPANLGASVPTNRGACSSLQGSIAEGVVGL